MHRFYSQLIDKESRTATLDESETRHLRDVLRIREGEQVRVFDGRGKEFGCIVTKIDKRSASLSIVAEAEPASPESSLDLTLAVALTKGDKFELVIQKAVELGVNAVVPIVTARCDVKAPTKGGRLERWRKIALDAAKQSGRAGLMEIGEITDFSSLLASSAFENKFLFSERGGGRLYADQLTGPVISAVGPEGGWEERELDAARDAGYQLVTFGGRILRAETAAIAIAAVLQNRFGDLN